jgi:hypothetical protein
MWFDNRNLTGTGDFLGVNSSDNLKNFFWDSSEADVLFVMVGHNYLHEKLNNPTDLQRQHFLNAVRVNFPGLVVFCAANPTVDRESGKLIHSWHRQLAQINTESMSFFARRGVPVIDPWRFVTNETAHLYADHIHFADQPSGQPGLLATTVLRQFASIVRAARSRSNDWCFGARVEREGEVTLL